MKSSFNHKTGAEDVHITSLYSHSDSESDADTNKSDVSVDTGDNETLIQDSYSDRKGSNTTLVAKNPSVSRDDTPVLEMIMVKDVEVGAEVRICSCSGSCFSNHFLASVISVVWGVSSF